MSEDASATGRFEEALRRGRSEKVVLRLYVAGATPASRRAIANVTAFCDKHLDGHYTLDVVDLYQRPHLAADEQIVAAPTLVRVFPEPMAHLVGDLSDENKVLVGLDLRPPDE